MAQRQLIIHIFALITFLFGLTVATGPKGSLCHTVYAQNALEPMFRSRPNITAQQTSYENTIQQEYPAIGKITARGDVIRKSGENREVLSVYYGTGIYVAELNDFGIVMTNWHVISDANKITVTFPNFTSEAVVILADETWDLAALVIHRPPFLPIPISLEVPQPGDELWVGGYGHVPGLDGFLLQAGKVEQYMILGKSSDSPSLPAETVSIGVGVRHGDSGGPVFNKYGELAGILWGTIDQETMATFCLRMQAFLTQAQYQLINSEQNPDRFFALMSAHPSIKKITRATTPAQTALQSSGIYPISTRPVYRKILNTKENPIEGGLIPSVKGVPLRHPPYPPVESPTLYAQRGVIGRNHPEVYPETATFLKKQTQSPVAESSAQSNFQNVSVPMSRNGYESNFQNTSTPTTRTAAESSYPNASPRENVPKNAPSNNITPSIPTEQPKRLNISQTAEETSIENPKTADKNNSTSSKDELIPYQIPLSDIQMGIVILIILFLFFNSLRFLAIAGEK